MLYKPVSTTKPVSALVPLAGKLISLGIVTSLTISTSLLNPTVIAPVGALAKVIVVPAIVYVLALTGLPATDTVVIFGLLSERGRVKSTSTPFPVPTLTTSLPIKRHHIGYSVTPFRR